MVRGILDRYLRVVPEFGVRAIPIGRVTSRRGLSADPNTAREMCTVRLETDGCDKTSRGRQREERFGLLAG